MYEDKEKLRKNLDLIVQIVEVLLDLLLLEVKKGRFNEAFFEAMTWCFNPRAELFKEEHF